MNEGKERSGKRNVMQTFSLTLNLHSSLRNFSAGEGCSFCWQATISQFPLSEDLQIKNVAYTRKCKGFLVCGYTDFGIVGCVKMQNFGLTFRRNMLSQNLRFKYLCKSDLYAMFHPTLFKQSLFGPYLLSVFLSYLKQLLLEIGQLIFCIRTSIIITKIIIFRKK